MTTHSICPPPPSELKIAQIVAFALLTALGASQVQAQGAVFPDPQLAGTTTPASVTGVQFSNSDCTATPIISITTPVSTVLTVVQGAPAAARTFALGTVSQRGRCYLIDYRVDALGAGNDLKIGQAAARDYMGLTLRTVGSRDFEYGDNPPLEEGALTARLGSDTSNVFEHGFGNYHAITRPEQQRRLVNPSPTTIGSFTFELELSPAPGIFTEGSVSRVQAACDNLGFIGGSCVVASQVFELRVIPALSNDVAVAAFNDADATDTDTPPDHYIATSDPMLFFKLALPNNLNLYEVVYEVRAEVIVGTNTGTTFTESLVPNTPGGVVGFALPFAAGDIIAIDAVATVQAEATHKRFSGDFLVTVVDDTSSINDDNNLDDEIVVTASHRVLPGVYALAADETQSARISNPAAVIPGASTPTGHIAEAGVFNFTVTGLTGASSRADVVITLETTLTTTAIPHKYAMATDTTTATWNVFDTSEGDTWYGAVMTDDDACPAVNSDAWKPEVLEAGDQCLRVTLTDGGANDADGVHNGVIHDPIALVALGGGSGASKGGGGAMHWLWLLIALLPLAMSFGARGRPFKNSGRGLPVNR